MTARGFYGGRKGAPKPPPELWEAMSAAWNDPVTLGRLHAEYLEHMTTLGMHETHLGRPDRADRAAQ